MSMEIPNLVSLQQNTRQEGSSAKFLRYHGEKWYEKTTVTLLADISHTLWIYIIL